MPSIFSAISSGRGSAQVLDQLPLNAGQLVDGFHHVHRDPDRPGLVGNGPGDGLTDPPGGIGGELESLGVVKFFHCLDQTAVAFLDQIQEQHAASHVLLRNGDHQTQVGADQQLLGLLAFCGNPVQFPFSSSLRSGWLSSFARASSPS